MLSELLLLDLLWSDVSLCEEAEFEALALTEAFWRALLLEELLSLVELLEEFDIAAEFDAEFDAFAAERASNFILVVVDMELLSDFDIELLLFVAFSLAVIARWSVVVFVLVSVRPLP